MPTQKPHPLHLIDKEVKVFGYSVATYPHLLWYSIWANRKAQGHADIVCLTNVKFELNLAAQAKSRGLKIDGSPSKTSILKRKVTGDVSALDARKTPFLFVAGTAQYFADKQRLKDLNLNHALMIEPVIDRAPNGVDAHFVIAGEDMALASAAKTILTPFGVFAWEVRGK